MLQRLLLPRRCRRLPCQVPPRRSRSLPLLLQLAHQHHLSPAGAGGMRPAGRGGLCAAVRQLLLERVIGGLQLTQPRQELLLLSSQVDRPRQTGVSAGMRASNGCGRWVLRTWSERGASGPALARSYSNSRACASARASASDARRASRVTASPSSDTRCFSTAFLCTTTHTHPKSEDVSGRGALSCLDAGYLLNGNQGNRNSLLPQVLQVILVRVVRQPTRCRRCGGLLVGGLRPAQGSPCRRPQRRSP